MTAGAGWHCGVAGTASQAEKEQHCSCVVQEKGKRGCGCVLARKEGDVSSLGRYSAPQCECCDVAKPAAVEDTLVFHPAFRMLVLQLVAPRSRSLGLTAFYESLCSTSTRGICANLTGILFTKYQKKHDVHLKTIHYCSNDT